MEGLAVDGAERAPGAIVVGVEVDGGGEAGDGLVPRLGFDREAAEEELRLGQARLLLGEAEQDRPSAVVRLLLDLEARQRQVRILGARAECDRALELGLGFRELPLGAQELGQRHVRRRLVRGQLHGPPGRAHGFVHVLRSHEQLGELRPEGGRVGITLERAPHQRDRLLEAAGLDEHLGDGVGVVRVGARVGSRRAPRDILVSGQRRAANRGTARQRRRDEDRG